MKKLIFILALAIVMIGQNLSAQNAGGNSTQGPNTTTVPNQDQVVVKNYVYPPQPKVTVYPPDVRVPVNITIEYPPAPAEPKQNPEDYTGQQTLLMMLIAVTMLLAGLFWGYLIRGRNDRYANPINIHNHGGAGGAGGDALAEMHSSTTISGPTK